MKAQDQAMAKVLADLRPVRPLPSTGVLLVQTLLLMLAVVAAGIWWLGSDGLVGLSLGQRIVFGASLSAALVVLAYGSAMSLVPGGLFRISVLPQAGALVLVFSLLVAFEFRRHYRFDLLPIHLKCFFQGLAITALVLSVLLIQQRRGLWADRAVALRIAFATAAATALVVLTIYCPIQSWTHVWIAHLGAVLVALLIGFGAAQLTR